MDDLERYVLRYGGMCHDCADEDWTCPTSGLPCDTDIKLKMVRRTIEALRYGISHGFIENPFTTDAGQSELERSEG